MGSNIMDLAPGWRGKFGWICPGNPSSHLVLDFHSMVPEGIEMKIATLGITTLNDEEIEMALSKLDDAVRRLAFVGATFISVEGILPLIKGIGFDREIIKRAETIARVPVTTTITAVVEALGTLKLNKVVMASPMTHEVDRRNRKFLEDSGIDVIHVKSLNITHNRDIAALPRSAAYALAKQACSEAPQAEGIYVACGAWCPPWVIDCLERDLGIPAITDRQATTWVGLRRLNIREPVRGWGRLFETLHQE